MTIYNYNTPYEIFLNTMIENGVPVPVSIVINNEPHVIYDSQIHLAQIPDEFYRVLIDGMTEIRFRDEIALATEFKVDYKHGVIYFDQSLEGNDITVGTYYGKGIKLIYAERVILGDVVGGEFKSLQDFINNDFSNIENELEDLSLDYKWTYGDTQPDNGWWIEEIV